MKIVSFICTIGGIIIVASENIYQRYLKLDNRCFSGKVVEDKVQEKINKFKAFQNIYNKYNFLMMGLVLSIVGTILSFLSK